MPWKSNQIKVLPIVPHPPPLFLTVNKLHLLPPPLHCRAARGWVTFHDYRVVGQPCFNVFHTARLGSYPCALNLIVARRFSL